MKLHELLAVESNLENQANKTRSDLVTTFEKKRHLFEKKLTVYTPKVEGEPATTQVQSEIQTTVTKELKWVSDFISKALDASYQVAETNTKARADIVLEDDTVLVRNVPATSLLELEKRLAELTVLINAIPTFDPARGFEKDTNEKEGYYKARPVSKVRTQKEKEVLVLYPATDKHPAQVQVIDKDVVIGTLEEQEWSGLVTPAAKSEYLARVENLTRAVRSARARANDTEVDKTKKIGSVLLNYVFGA